MIILGGELNKLQPIDIIDRIDLILVIDAPTRGESHLDHILVRNVVFARTKIINPVSNQCCHMAIVTCVATRNYSLETALCMYVR
jgi:hypothetical protein